MGISLLLVCGFFQVVAIASATRIIYQNERKSYDEASQYCQSFNGSLLSYGRLVVEAADKCGMVGFAWVGKPWLQQGGDAFFSQGCYCVNPANYGLSENFKETSSFECAAFCKEDDHKFIGIKNQTCACFAYKPNTQDISKCDSVRCGTRTRERCGVGNNIYIYKKADTFNNDLRQTFQRTANGSIGLQRNLFSDILHFFCLVAEDDKSSEVHVPVDCLTSVNTTSTTRVTVRATTTSKLKYITIPTKETTTLQFLVKRITVAKNDGVQHPNDNRLLVGLIAGVATLALAVLLVIVGLCWKHRKKKPQQETSQDDRGTDTLQANTKCEASSDMEHGNEDDDDGVYDHTNHTLVRHDDTSGNIYDHSYTVEGVYDSAAAVTHTMSENTYGYGSAMSVKNSNTEENTKD